MESLSCVLFSRDISDADHRLLIYTSILLSVSPALVIEDVSRPVVWIDSGNKLQPPDPSKHVPVQIIFCMKVSITAFTGGKRLIDVGEEPEKDQFPSMVLQRLWSLSPPQVSPAAVE